MDKSISKQINLCLKSIAIILMYFLHVFTYLDRIKEGSYIGIFKINNLFIEQYIGMFGSICVMIFLFLSGYGLYINNKENIKFRTICSRIFKFYINFWIVFILFIPIGFFIGKYKFNINDFILNFLGLRTTYNGEWWFISLYIFFIISYPIISKVINRLSFNKSVCATLSTFVIGMILIKMSIIFNLKFLGTMGNFITWWIYFISGILVCKYEIFDRAKLKLKKINLDRKAIYILIFIISIGLYFILPQIALVKYFDKILVVLMFIFSTINLVKPTKLSNLIGKNSTNMWLMHSFFCYYLFNEFTYRFKYSIIIILQLIIITLILSAIINKIISIINQILFEKGKNSFINNIQNKIINN